MERLAEVTSARSVSLGGDSPSVIGRNATSCCDVTAFLALLARHSFSVPDHKCHVQKFKFTSLA